MKILKEYLNLQKKIYEYFNCYNKDILPIEDSTDIYWNIPTLFDEVHFCTDRKTLEKIIINGYSYIPYELRSSDYSADDISSGSGIDKGVSRGEEYTMIVVSNLDGKTSFKVFDNAKEIKNE